MKQGDLVTRKSYGGDIVFRIQRIEQDRAILCGVEYRLLADAPFTDLVPLNGAEDVDSPRYYAHQAVHSMRRLVQDRIRLHEKSPYASINKGQAGSYYFEVPGTVLHLDGDPMYLRKCMTLYEEMRIPAHGFYMQESQMADSLRRLLPTIKPNIVVITGHDGFVKNRRDMDVMSLSSYKNSSHFVRAVEVAREYERNRDSLTVIAGACQSHFEALLQAGANFASSPARVLIHALDPLLIASKMSFSSVKETVSMIDLMESTVTGLEGMGGVETKGSYRMGLPRLEKIEMPNSPA
ncbi:sporulation peptidase YabG [Paenibacillus albiflavus]|uniref:Sporulation peptidase YabG n=1 Tax=Paenibacillus albiflavus TaxID=2545760 RepID=A0A4R4E3F3_9BACL|nr:sporulation peptidase YabG [Paenibacillus albiflavus]TCZ70540.1 sporulation peptidase YabG [Paenibacillus albiflavus]